MNYEKEYKKLKADIKKAYLFAQTNSTKAVLEHILPELRESEDERVRNEIIAFVEQAIHRGGGTPIPQEQEDSWIAWLEKQRESQNEVRYWTEEEIEPIISDYLRGAEHYGGMIARLRCLKPKSLEKQGQKETTWNKEDEENMNNVIYIFNQLKDNSPYKEDDIAEKTINWLKSLKSRKQWKPSEEQMNALAEALILAKNCGEENAFDLRTLYEQLKKL